MDKSFRTKKTKKEREKKEANRKNMIKVNMERKTTNKRVFFLKNNPEVIHNNLVYVVQKSFFIGSFVKDGDSLRYFQNDQLKLKSQKNSRNFQSNCFKKLNQD